MSNDPVDFLEHLNGTQGVQGFNRYAYVNNNPYKYTDPDGQQADQNLGRGLYLLFFSDDSEKEKVEQHRQQNEAVAKAGVEILKASRGGIIIDAGEIVVDSLQGEDVKAEAAGVLAGEAGGAVTNSIPSKKTAAKEVIGAIIGFIVGEQTEAAVEQHLENNVDECSDTSC